MAFPIVKRLIGQKLKNSHIEFVEFVYDAEEDGKNILDQAFKGAIKTVYRAKMAVGETLGEEKETFFRIMG